MPTSPPRLNEKKLSVKCCPYAPCKGQPVIKWAKTFVTLPGVFDDEFQNKEFKLNEDIISFSQEYSDRKDNTTTITIDFKISKNLDEVIDLLDTVNSFFVLINNVPSEIKDILVLNDSNVQYEVNENWLDRKSVV